MATLLRILTLLFFLLLLKTILSVLKFNDLKCKFVDDIAVVDICKLQVLTKERTSAAIQISWRKPLNNIKVFVEFKHKSAEYYWRPFYFKGTIDFCDYMKNRKKYMLISGLQKFYENYTNVNHTCPFEVDEKFILVSYVLPEMDFIKVFPLNYGEYGVFTKWYINRQFAGAINVTAIYKK